MKILKKYSNKVLIYFSFFSMIYYFFGKFYFNLINYFLKIIVLNTFSIGKILVIRNNIFKSLSDPKYNNIIQDTYNSLNSISYKKSDFGDFIPKL